MTYQSAELDLFASGGEPRSPEAEVFTVSEVNRAVRLLLERSLRSCWVTGEVGGWTRARSGHRYFTLKDDTAQLRCVMWRSDAARLPADPDEGMEIRAYGRLTLYEARGSYQLAVTRLEVGGEGGLWKLAFDRLREKLDEEGLLAVERKRPLPAFPRRVGVVTSTSGAALRDVLSVLRRRAPWVHVVVRGARVQGEGAASEIAAALRALGASGLADVVIVGRGGGSIEDLWAFNEEVVARAIADCPVPVVSGVGHETDVTISDLVADHRAPTPSAAAEAVVQDGSVIREALDTIRPRLGRGLRRTVRWKRDVARRALAEMARALAQRLGTDRRHLARARESLSRAAVRGIRARRATLETVSARMEALSPLSTLRRGYAVPRSTRGRLLTALGDFHRGDRFELRVIEGRVEAEVVGTEEDPLVGASGDGRGPSNEGSAG